MRSATQRQKLRRPSTPMSAPLPPTAKFDSLRISSTPSNGTSDSTASSAITVAIRPASPNVRIASELENCNAMNEIPAVPCVSTQAGPTTSTASRNAVYLSLPAISRSRAANVSCMLSEKLITMISGVITLRNMLRLKLSQPSAPSDNRIAISGGAAAMIMNEMRRKNSDRDQAARGEANGVVKQRIALDGVADLELHGRHAGQLHRKPGRRRGLPA